MAEETRWLNENETNAWRAMLRAHASIVASLDRELNSTHSLGLPDYEVLQQLSEEADGSLRMTALANSVMLSPSGLTRRLDGLVKQGLVERQPAPSDGRGLLAVLTDKGRDKVREMAPAYVQGVRDHFIDCVDQHQLKFLIDIFQPIAEKDGGACIDSNGTNDDGENGGVHPHINADLRNRQQLAAG